MHLGRATLAPILSGTLLLNAAQLSGQELRTADRVRIAEARRLAAAVDAQWPGWDEVPFALLLVTEDYEFLLGHPAPTDDSVPSVTTSALGKRFCTVSESSSPTCWRLSRQWGALQQWSWVCRSRLGSRRRSGC